MTSWTIPAMSQRAPGIEVNRDLEVIIVSGLSAERTSRHASAATFLEKLAAVDLTNA